MARALLLAATVTLAGLPQAVAEESQDLPPRGRPVGELKRAIATALAVDRPILVFLEPDARLLQYEHGLGCAEVFSDQDWRLLDRAYVTVRVAFGSPEFLSLSARYGAGSAGFCILLLGTRGELLDGNPPFSVPGLLNHVTVVAQRLEEYRRVVRQLEAQEPAALRQLAALHARFAAFESAIPLYVRLLEKGEDLTTLTALAVSQRHVADLAGERQTLRRMLRAFPKHPESIEWRIREATLEKPPLEVPGPGYLPPRSLYALLTALDKAGQTRSASRVRYVLATGYTLPIASALRLLEEIVAKVPVTDLGAEVRILLAMTYAEQLSDPARACFHLEQFLKTHPRHPQAREIRSEVLPALRAGRGGR